MCYRKLAVVSLSGMLAAAVGCGSSSSDGLARSPHQAASSTQYVRVYLDDQPAVPVETEVAVPGVSHWRITKPVSSTPRLKYEVRQPKLAETVSVAILRQTGSNGALPVVYTIYSSDPKEQDLIRPGVEHNLGNPPDKIEVVDASRKPVDGVHLKSGEKYKLVLALGNNQTAEVDFVTQ